MLFVYKNLFQHHFFLDIAILISCTSVSTPSIIAKFVLFVVTFLVKERKVQYTIGKGERNKTKMKRRKNKRKKKTKDSLRIVRFDECTLQSPSIGDKGMRARARVRSLRNR